MNKFINQVEPDITEEDIQAVNNYLSSGGWITEHKVSEELSNSISRKVFRNYSCMVPNGTIALYLAIIAMGLDNGKRIAVPNLTMIATVNSIIWANSTPVLIDVDESLCMSLELLEKAENLDAVIFVPLNGRTGDAVKIEQYCKENNLILIEDSAHALGSNYLDKPCGKLGDISIFSFTPHKIITMGQGGQILTDDEKAFEKILELKLFNRSKDKNDWHEGFGLNFKITDLQAALGLSQFFRLEKYIENKRKNYKYLKKNLSNDVIFLNFDEYETPWFNDALFKNENEKEKYKNLLKINNIETRDFYPALSKQRFLKKYADTDLKYSENIFSRLLWLPSSNNLNFEELDRIISILSD